MPSVEGGEERVSESKQEGLSESVKGAHLQKNQLCVQITAEDYPAQHSRQEFIQLVKRRSNIPGNFHSTASDAIEVMAGQTQAPNSTTLVLSSGASSSAFLLSLYDPTHRTS